jgi:hypothetical protein
VTAQAVFILIAGIAGMLGIAIGMTRWSVAKYAELRKVAEASDRAMRDAASALALSYLAQPGYEHPIVGSIAGFGKLDGVLDGVRVRAFVNVDSERSFARTELVAELSEAAGSSSREIPSPSERYRLVRDGAKLTLHPTLPKTGSWLFIAYEVVTDGALLSELLRELSRIARDARRG